ncbi:hypothetical protein [Paraglaciecola sp. L3A3]|uniref:hypothetical protein n=1 Tax=Paraglaciecola sp. L3A3 TaxID=2686358 RepID=UPI00131E2CE3|nr:hypothetical protein [Paraglaciecola sp. L3A3]
MRNNRLKLLSLTISTVLTISSCSTSQNKNKNTESEAVPAQSSDVIAEEARQQQKAKNDRESEMIEVSGYRRSVEEQNIRKRHEKGIVDSIIAEDVGKMDDANVAEALQRISGISISRDEDGNIDSQPSNVKKIEQINLRSPYQIFKKYGVNPTIETSNKAISTFSMDVDFSFI